MRKISLLITSSFLFGCAVGLPPFPVKELFVTDITHKVCGHYIFSRLGPDNEAVYDKQPDLALSACNGNVSIKPKDYLAADDWRKEVQNDYECKRKQ